jgi:hypothetical protein
VGGRDGEPGVQAVFEMRFAVPMLSRSNEGNIIHFG